jgi:hypothetical protein
VSKQNALRIAEVTVGLAAVGAGVGSVLGGFLAAMLAARMGGFGRMGGFQVLLAGASFGATAGVVLAPLAAWTLMRRVPIWRAIAETALGTVVGAGIGLLIAPNVDSVLSSPLVLGLAGFALASLRLRLMKDRVPLR